MLLDILVESIPLKKQLQSIYFNVSLSVSRYVLLVTVLGYIVEKLGFVQNI